MEESFLHFIWKFQYFNKRPLESDSGHEIVIFNAGFQNSNAGPDCMNAKIKIDEITWNGNVEIHVNAKDWYRHNHDRDTACENVVLHVVWKNDTSVLRKDNTAIPTLELKNIIDENLILNYNKLFVPGHEILCKNFLESRNPIKIFNMMDKALTQRLEKKAEYILRLIALTNGDWEEIAWQLLCKNFGFKANAYPFSELTKSLPFKILKKESDQATTIEALLFGQAGFLEKEIDDPYFNVLKKEYLFKQKKYKLERRLDEHQWKFLRLRPANFPTIRIAQLSNLIANHKNLFSFFTNYSTTAQIKKDLKAVQSDYWKSHYHFDKKSNTKIGLLGKSSVDNILINTVAPLVFTYGIHKNEEDLKEKAMELLTEVKPEANSIINKWKDLGVEVKSAFDSQALIELYNEYCLRKRCLNCSIVVDIESGN